MILQSKQNYFLIILIPGKENLKLEVAFGEEIASELHNSTEELSFHGNETAERNHWKNLSSQVVLVLVGLFIFFGKLTLKTVQK